MDDLNSSHKEHFEEKLSHLDKRLSETHALFDKLISSIRLVSVIGFGVVGSIIAIVTIWVGVGFHFEKNELKEFKNEMTEKVDKKLGNYKPAKLEIHDVSGNKLEGNVVDGSVYVDRYNHPVISIPIRYKNVGESTTEIIITKGYSNSPITLAKVSTDEPEYSTETNMQVGDFLLGTLYPNLSAVENAKFVFFGRNKLEKGKYPVKIKVYYGSQDPVVADFFVEIKETWVADEKNSD
jgi:hypothetical protein